LNSGHFPELMTKKSSRFHVSQDDVLDSHHNVLLQLLALSRTSDTLLFVHILCSYRNIVILSYHYYRFSGLFRTFDIAALGQAYSLPPLIFIMLLFSFLSIPKRALYQGSFLLARAMGLKSNQF